MCAGWVCGGGGVQMGMGRGRGEGGRRAAALSCRKVKLYKYNKNFRYCKKYLKNVT